MALRKIGSSGTQPRKVMLPSVPQNTQQGMPFMGANFVPEKIQERGVTYVPGLPQRVAEESAMVKAKKQAELEQKRDDLGNDLQNFLQVDFSIPRGKGAERFGEGVTTKIEGLTRETPRGRAAGMHDAASKRLRVQLVRAAGDVGNINIVEQEAAEKIIPSIWDDEETADIKRAYLLDILEGVETRNKNRVRKALERAGVNWSDVEKGMERLEVRGDLADRGV